MHNLKMKMRDGMLMFEKYEAQVLTYELPVISEENSLKQIWEKNSEGLKNLFSSNLI